MAMCSACSSGGAPFSSRWASVSPSRHSMTRKSIPSWLPTSKTGQMLGWLSAVTVFASRSNRCFRSASEATCSCRTLMATWFVSQARWHVGRPLCERPPPLYPRGPWLRAELCCLSPSSRTATPSASLAGTRRLHGCTAYTSRLRCAGTPRQPTRPSLLSLLHCPHVPPTLRRRVRDVVLLHERRDTRLPRRLSESPPAQCPSLPAIPDGDGFSTLHRSLYAAARAFAKPSRLATTKGITRDAFGLLRYRVTPALDAGRHRPALGVRLGGRTGNLPPSGLAPD